MSRKGTDAKPCGAGRMGFTLMEIMVASAISLIVIGGVTVAFIEGLKVWQQEEIRNELNFNLETAMERIRADLRLSTSIVGEGGSKGFMAFYPPTGGVYTAISIPIAEPGPDGLLQRDTNGMIRWTQTVIYHVRPGDPDKLLRTVFDNRYTNATAEQILQQLANVVAATNDSEIAACALPGETASSRIVFENLVDLRFYPPWSQYDCYGPYEHKAATYNWGSLILGLGDHKLVFTVTGKNSLSSGYKIPIDKFTLSASAGERDAELYFPVNSHPCEPWFQGAVSGGTVSVRQRSSDYAGYADLLWSPSGTGATLHFTVYNDIFCDNSFDAPGSEIASNCSVRFTTNFGVPDVVVAMDKGVAWDVTMVSQGNPSVAQYQDWTSVTNIIYGGTNNPDATITKNGRWVRFTFQRGTNRSLYLANARIQTWDGSAASNITFNGGQNILYMSCDGPMQTNSDWVQEWDICMASNYIVRYDTWAPTNWDLDMDLPIGDMTTPQIRYFANAGTTSSPAFPSRVDNWQGISGSGAITPAFADLDGDGDYDLVVGVIGASPCFKGYRNVGTTKNPVYQAEPTCFGLNSVMSYSANPTPTFVDIDNDGDLDMLSGYQYGGVALYLNVGTSWSPSWVYAGTLKDAMGAEIDPGEYSIPELFDVDNDGDLDLILGNDANTFWYYRNDGSAASASWVYVTNAWCNLTNDSTRCMARFADIDADGLPELFVGSLGGKIWFYENTGTLSNPLWAEPNKSYLNVIGRAAPASGPKYKLNNKWVYGFPNLDGEFNGVTAWPGLGSVPWSSVNGATNGSVQGLVSFEVGYPRFALYRSKPYDTMKDDPEYDELNFTRYLAAGGDLDVRVRASAFEDMRDVGESDWTAWSVANEQVSLAGLPHRRYVQYEARFECGAGGVTSAHTNQWSAVLRDLTIDWPAAERLVDLTTDFTRAPDCGIVSATVDGRSFVKAVEVEMTIYKAGRTGTNYATGILEVRCLNTGL